MAFQFNNPNDPIGLRTTDKEKEVFLAFTRLCETNGLSHDEVVSIATNVVVNAIRQSWDSRVGAFEASGRVTTAMCDLLDKHYDSVTNKRRNIFPFEQRVQVSHFVDKDTIRG